MQSTFLKLIHWIKHRPRSIKSLIKYSIIPSKTLTTLVANLSEGSIIVDLGSGEGYMINHLARIFPNHTFLGIDHSHIKSCTYLSNSNHITNDVFIWLKNTEEKSIDLIIVNDFLHHFEYKQHKELIRLIHRALKPEGLFFLKEVDQSDKIDLKMTTFFDERIYPNTPLCFRTKREWINYLAINNFNLISCNIYKHPWVASRTMLTFSKENVEYKFNDNLTKTKGINVLVTGATGFIGRHFIDCITTKASEDVCIFILSRSIMQNKSKKIHVLHGDFDDLEEHELILKNIDYVYHLSSEVSFYDPIDLQRNNVDATKKLLLRLDSRRLKKFIYLSTVGAIDRSKFDDCKTPLNENSTPHPQSKYGLSKLHCEEVLKESGYNYLIIRIPWCYGSNMTDGTHLKVIYQGVSNRKLFSYFNFNGRVSVIHVDDLCNILFDCMQPNLNKNTYFVSSDTPVRLGDLIKYIKIGRGIFTPTIRIPKFIDFLIYKLRSKLPLTVVQLSLDYLWVSNSRLSNDYGSYEYKSIEKRIIDIEK